MKVKLKREGPKSICYYIKKREKGGTVGKGAVDPLVGFTRRRGSSDRRGRGEKPLRSTAAF